MTNRVSKTPMYCITHESWGLYLCDDILGVPCLWVTSAPPELPEHWDELVTEPTTDELAQMDLNAQEILLDFGL